MLMKSQKKTDHDGSDSKKGKNLEGKYANYFKVGYNAFEFVLDFGQYYPDVNEQYYPGTEEAELYTRIITSPGYAKELLIMLRDSIERYEHSFGEISEE